MPNSSHKSEMVRVQVWQRLNPFRWRGGLREVALILTVYGAYWLTRGSLPDRVVVAVQNAYDIVDFERYLGFFWEKDIQSWFLDTSFLTDLANNVYTYFYYPVLITFAIWAYNRHRKQYKTARNVFLVSAGIGFLCFALYPLAPPRMLLSFGFVDTMAQYGTLDYSHSFFRTFANPYAAMPSLHFGWVMLIGISTFKLAKAIWLKVLAILVPLCMLISIIATANHFIIDAIAGAIVIGLAYGLVILFTRLRSKGISPLALLRGKAGSNRAEA